MVFRLTSAFYLVALLAAALALLGIWGLVATAGVLLFWAAIHHHRELTGIAWGAPAGVILTTIALLSPPFTGAREAARASSCLGHVCQIRLAIAIFHEATGSFPATTSTDAASGESCSWRIALLPYMECQSIYRKYAFDEPWNSPSNRKISVSSGRSGFFECPTHGVNGETSYFAIVGPQTAWGNGAPRGNRDITDDPSQTILLIEAAGRGVDWKEPRDLTFDQAVELLCSPIQPLGNKGHTVVDGFFYKPRCFRNVAMCEGPCVRLRAPIDRDLAIALLTANGGETIDFAKLERLGQPELDYARICASGAFVPLVVLPGIPRLRRWVWIVPNTNAVRIAPDPA